MGKVRSILSSQYISMEGTLNIPMIAKKEGILVSEMLKILIKKL